MGTLVFGREHFRFVDVEAYTSSPQDESRLSSALDAAQPGDLLLVKTPGLLYSFGRRLTRNIYDHIAVVMEDGETLNIVQPRAVVLPVRFFSRAERKPLILRPQWTDPAQSERFVLEMKKFSSGKYNLGKTLVGIATSALYGWLGIRLPMRKPSDSAPKWICTEAIISSLERALPGFEVTSHDKLDYNALGFATTNDFLRVAREHPDLLRVLC